VVEKSVKARGGVRGDSERIGRGGRVVVIWGRVRRSREGEMGRAI